jgi:hypothetical protein
MTIAIIFLRLSSRSNPPLIVLRGCATSIIGSLNYALGAFPALVDADGDVTL